jgi:hypothetical protein
MALVTGQITHHGALVTLLVAVSRRREEKLAKVGLRIPSPVPIRAEIDTGSFVSGFPQSVFASLQIEPFKFASVRTPSTAADEACLVAQYDVSVVLVSGMDTYRLTDVHAIASAGFHSDEEVQGIIGRDILNHCEFRYHGPTRLFELAF